MKRTRVYLSGGMSKFGKENYDESNNWRVDITRDLVDGSMTEIECFNPNHHFSFKDFDIDKWSEREIMNYDIKQLLQCDVVIYNANDPYSLGSMAELAIAYTNNIPIYILNKKKHDLHPWIKNMAEHIFEYENELIDYILNHYSRVCM